jgi:hypothetical protein
MDKLPAMKECPSCGRPLDPRLAVASGERGDENVRCPTCGWERDGIADPQELSIDDTPET